MQYGHSLEGLEREIRLYSETDHEIRTPKGYLDRLISQLKEEQVRHRLIDKRICQQYRTFKTNKNLWSFQQKVVEEAFSREQGVIQSPSGSGKTVIGLFLVAKCQQKALWITHTVDLLSQTVDKIETFLGIPKTEVGIIGDGYCEIGNNITVGLVQSLVKIPINNLDQFGMIIVDEAHRVPTKTFLKIVNHLSAKFCFGLTATAKRGDGLEQILFDVIGPTVAVVEEKDLINENKIILPEVVQVPTLFKAVKNEQYSKLLTELIEDRDRNRFIVQTIINTFNQGDFGIVFTDRINHCHTLTTMLKSDLRVAAITGKTKNRHELFAKMKKGELDLIIATKLANEGLDVPLLNRLYLTTPTRSKIKIKQQLGRIMRQAGQKKAAFVYDFVDQQIATFRIHAKMRLKVYKELGCELNVHEMF